MIVWEPSNLLFVPACGRKRENTFGMRNKKENCQKSDDQDEFDPMIDMCCGGVKKLEVMNVVEWMCCNVNE